MYDLGGLEGTNPYMCEIGGSSDGPLDTTTPYMYDLGGLEGTNPYMCEPGG